jgi:hypothetical protein
MRSSSWAGVLLFAMAWAAPAAAQQQAQGFGVERFYPSAPGAGWFVMDSLDMHGNLGGVMALTMGYAHDPWRVRSSDGSQRLAVVSDDAFADFGFAVTYQRFRLYLNIDMPLAIEGQSGTIGGVSYTAPSVDPGSSPDALLDARIGFDARILGDERSPFRLGAGAQLYVPNGNTCWVDTTNAYRCDYDTDGTYRAMGRVLFAGDVGAFTYAGHVGIHIRPRDDSPVPGPRGSELLFGAAAGGRIAGVGTPTTALVIGPEVYGASALQSLFGTSTTALEALMTARVEGTGEEGPHLRFKLGPGVGLDQHFGAPEWRVVVGIELFDQVRQRRP